MKQYSLTMRVARTLDQRILRNFTYHSSEVHKDGGQSQEVTRIALAHAVMDSLNTSNFRCRYLCRWTKIRIFKSLVIPVLLYGCKTLALKTALKRRIGVFGARCLRRIMGYRQYDCQISDCSVRPIRGLILAQSVSANCGYIGMWRDTGKPILLIGLFPKEITQLGGGQRDGHRTLGCGKSITPAGSHSVWDGSLHRDSCGVTPELAQQGRRGNPPPGIWASMID